MCVHEEEGGEFCQKKIRKILIKFSFKKKKSLVNFLLIAFGGWWVVLFIY